MAGSEKLSAGEEGALCHGQPVQIVWRNATIIRLAALRMAQRAAFSGEKPAAQPQ